MDSSPMMEEEAMEVEQPRKDIFSSAHKESVTEAVIQTLRKNGVDTASLSQQGRGGGGAIGGNGNGKIFGLSLEDGRQERRVTETNGSPCYLPKFFVTSIEFLRNHVKTEGLFRKAGSCVRQKQLRLFLEEGNADIPGNADPHDVASLLKQYLRELPVPLLTHSLSLVLLECNELLSDEKEQDSHSISKTEAILMSCLLLPTQHLLCLQILTNLLHDVAVHSNDSRMDSNSLAVVLTPNIFSLQETKKGKKNTKGGGGVGPGDIKSMTSITTVLIDQYHLIGQVPLVIDVLSNEIHTQSLKNQYSTGGASRGKNKQRKKSLSTRETVSSLLRGTLNKIRGGGGENKEEGVYSPSTSIDDSPDALGPTASKRMALDDSSDISGHNESGNSSSSSFSFNPNIRKKLFNKGTRSKKKYPFLRKAKKNVENVPLLSNDNTEGTQQKEQEQQEEEEVEPVSSNDDRPPSALPSPLLNSTTNLDLLTISPLTTSIASRLNNNIQLHTPVGHGASPSASPHVVSATDAVMESPLSSNYKLVSRTRRTYCRNPAPAVVRACPSPYSFQPPVERVPTGSQPVKLVRPVLTDHNSRKRRQVQFGQSGYHCGGFELLPKPFTFSPVGSGTATSGRLGSSSVSNRAQLASSTPLERKHKKETVRGRPEDDYMIKGTSSTSETVTNNDSYLCAVENGRDRETPLRRKLYESSNINSSTTRGVKTGSNGSGSIGRRANSMKVTPTSDATPSTENDRNISKKGRRHVVKSQSMSSRGINTARSPWINRKGIEVSEWII
ncbi:PREDICTED: mental retardation GTPase activating protein homolog 2-like [Amphimedon queenslandica]|uniref:Rho-GAP domain-containing protein n=1 Tax=Amphimedon queenslandica TaxID=400682 RepID=A0A1X7V2W9_AMPQE|nr:PREDICTED: mental retardation GTPase activating protein homolog 2-like [Amphimedon queenslandica]|eukprot:XP_019850791.1 PREDICTED: mental retardation GTPase activating protein homolog 2-like [Amphimedon queenslandica]